MSDCRIEANHIYTKFLLEIGWLQPLNASLYRESQAALQLPNKETTKPNKLTQLIEIIVCVIITGLFRLSTRQFIVLEHEWAALAIKIPSWKLIHPGDMCLVAYLHLRPIQTKKQEVRQEDVY